MPIKGLTDRGTISPKLPIIGKLRKGGPKSSANKPGADLDHFRFTSNNPDVVALFNEIYGEKPRVINIVMWYETLEECFGSWIEEWDGSGLVFRSDGEHVILWRDGDHYSHRQKKHRDTPGMILTGRLSVVIPELWMAGHCGTVTMETHSNHDLRHIPGVLLAAELSAKRRDATLHGEAFVLRRVQEEISTPGWGDRKGKRSRTKKWLVKLEPPAQMLQFAAPQGERPALTVERHALTVDSATGEVLDVEPAPTPGRAAKKPVAATPPEKAQAQPPADEQVRNTPEELGEVFDQYIEEFKSMGYSPIDDVDHNNKRISIITSLEACFEGTNAEDARHVVQEHLTGVGSISDMDDAEIYTLYQWCKAKKVGEEWLVSALVVQEARAIYEFVTSRPVVEAK